MEGASGRMRIDQHGVDTQNMFMIICVGPEVGGKKNPIFWYLSWPEAVDTVKNAVSQHLHSKDCGPNTLEDRLPLLDL